MFARQAYQSGIANKASTKHAERNVNKRQPGRGEAEEPDHMRSISVRLAPRAILAKVFFFDRQKRFNLSSAYEFFDPGSYPLANDSVTTPISITFAIKCHIVESTRISPSLS